MNRGERSPDVDETRHKYEEKLGDLSRQHAKVENAGDKKSAGEIKQDMLDVVDEWNQYDTEVLYVDPKSPKTRLEHNLQAEAKHLTHKKVAQEATKKLRKLH